MTVSISTESKPALGFLKGGVFLGFVAYAGYAWSDALIKSVSGRLSVFEIAFYATLFTAIFMALTKPRTERLVDFWRMSDPWRVHLRAIVALLATLCSIYTFTTIPLAEAYAIVFVAPLFTTVLAVIFLKESVGVWRWLAVGFGFVGVLLVVRPGFRELSPGHLSALAVALLSATAVILMRHLSNREKRTTIFGAMMVYGLVANAPLAYLTSDGAPDWLPLLATIAAGASAAMGHNAMYRAAQLVPANMIAPSQYTQIAWAVMLGALFFEEVPDALAVVGLFIIVGSGLFTALREQIRLGSVRWNPFDRPRI